jgi:hypothetical protein
MGYEYNIKLTSVCGYLAIGQQFPAEPSSTVSSVKPPKWLLQVQRTQSWDTSTDISPISGPATQVLSPHLPSFCLRGFHDYEHELSVYFTKKGCKEFLLNAVADWLVFLSQNREFLVSDFGQKTDNLNNLSWFSSVLPDNCCDPILPTTTIPSFHVLSNP